MQKNPVDLDLLKDGIAAVLTGECGPEVRAEVAAVIDAHIRPEYNFGDLLFPLPDPLPSPFRGVIRADAPSGENAGGDLLPSPVPVHTSPDAAPVLSEPTPTPAPLTPDTPRGSAGMGRYFENGDANNGRFIAQIAALDLVDLRVALAVINQRLDKLESAVGIGTSVAQMIG